MRLIIIISAILVIFLPVSHAQEVTSNLAQSQVDLEERFVNAQKEAIAGKPSKAIELFEAMHKENRTNAAIAMELAKLYDQKNDLALVDKYARIAAENAPDNIYYLTYYADFLLTNNRAEDAIVYFIKLKTLHPSQPRYYQNLVDAYLVLDKKNEAILVYDEMEKNTGNIIECYLSRFELFEALGKDDLALAQIDHLIRRHPMDITYLKAKARFFTRKKKVEEAMALYKQVLKLSPDDTDANLAVLSKGEETEKPNAYLMTLVPIVSNPAIPIDAKVKELMPYLNNLADGKDKDLIPAMKELADKLMLTHPDDAKAYSLYGDVLYFSGETEQAIAKYEKTLSLNQKVFSVWEQLMYAYYDQSDFTALLKKSEKALNIFPNQAMSYFFNAMAKAENNLADDAIIVAEEGKIVCGTNKVQLSMMQTALAKAQLAKKDWKKSQEALDEALLLSHNNNGLAMEVQADLYLAQTQPAKALEIYSMLEAKGNHTKRLQQKLMNLKGN